MVCRLICTFFVPVSVGVLLTACGGGGGGGSTTDGGTPTSLTITGVAATGAAISGGTVSAKCSSGTGSATTNADGSYSLSVTSGVQPCVLKAVDPVSNASFFSVLEAGQTVANVTPLTTLVAANVLEDDPAVIYDTSSASGFAKITTSRLVSAKEVLVEVSKTFGSEADLTGFDPLKDQLVAKTEDVDGNDLDRKIDILMATLEANNKAISDLVTLLKESSDKSVIAQSVRVNVVVKDVSSSDKVSSDSPAQVTGLTKVMEYSNERKKSQVFNARVVDINADGLEDVVIAGWAVEGQDSTRNSFVDLIVLIQKSDGTLEDKSSDLFRGEENTIFGAQRVLLEDFDADGSIDIFLGGFQDVPSHDAPSVMFWNEGTLFRRQDFDEKVWAHNVCAGDIFGTGRLDILMGGNEGRDYTLYRNNGGRSFELSEDIPGLVVSSAGDCAILRDDSSGLVAIIDTNVVGGGSHSAVSHVFNATTQALSRSGLPGSEEPDGWNLVHDFINVVPFDLNADGQKDLIMVNNGNFRLNKPVGSFTALINEGAFTFQDATDEYFPTQTKDYVFGYYGGFLNVNGKPNLFLGNPAVQNTTSLWQFDGSKFTPQYSEKISAVTGSEYSYLIPYRTSEKSLNLLIFKSTGSGNYVLYTDNLK